MKIKNVFLASGLVLAATATSAADLSYNISAVTLYKASGVDQDYSTANDAGFDKATRPAIQGGVDADLGGGLYVGNWNSTGEFGDASIEVDLYGGYAGELSGGLSYDVGYAHYVYPGQSDWNGGELYVSMSMAGLTAKITNGLNGSTKDGDNPKRRLSFTYDLAVSEAVGLSATYGVRNAAAGSFNDYALGMTYAMDDTLTFSATLAGGTNSAADAARKGRLILGVGTSF